MSSRALIVTNTTVGELYLKPLLAKLTSVNCETLIIEDGEQFKTLTTFNKILDALANGKHHRDTTLIALGGGVVGDMTGFAAACYHRGVAFIQIPTTLLSQVDASIGGKTGVNHPMGKNLIGAFHQPQAVIIDTDTLHTLPDREFRAGIAEIIKAALIQNAQFFDWLCTNIDSISRRDPGILATAIERACIIKADIVALDEKENNIRALLNFGHTFGHAIEKILNYGTWLHGEAVAMGILMASELSVRLGWLQKSDNARIIDLITKTGLPTRLPKEINHEALHEAMTSDKKVLRDQIRFVLLRDIGKGVISNEVPESTLVELLKDFTQTKEL